MRLSFFTLFLVAFFVHEGEETANFFQTILLDNQELVRDAKAKATVWLESQRESDWGWGLDTPRMILSLHLANDTWFQRENFQSQLSLKQMEIELLLEFYKRPKTKAMKPGRLAQFVNALRALCKNPSFFYEYDLLAELHHSTTITHPFELAHVTLAKCNNGRYLRRRQINQLLTLAHRDLDTDTSAMLVMALQCLAKKHQLPGHSQERVRLVKKLKSYQREDGSFGNIHTSALVTQALLSSTDEDGSWNATTALHFLLSQQEDSGAFRDVWATSDVLPILNGNSYADIVTGECHDDADIDEPKVTHVPEGPPINIKFSLWIDDENGQNHSISLIAPGNISFYEMMKHAAEQDQRFMFTALKSSIGPYIQSINDVYTDQEAGKYWFLGKMENDDTLSLVDVGVDKLYPLDGEHIVFWYKPTNFTRFEH